MRVDLPAPFSPQIAWISPARTVMETLESALTPGNSFVMERISRIGGVWFTETSLSMIVQAVVMGAAAGGVQRGGAAACVLTFTSRVQSCIPGRQVSSRCGPGLDSERRGGRRPDDEAMLDLVRGRRRRALHLVEQERH